MTRPHDKPKAKTRPKRAESLPAEPEATIAIAKATTWFMAIVGFRTIAPGDARPPDDERDE